MDLKDLTPKSDTLVIELLHPSTGDKLENEDGSVMTITKYAPHSKEYKTCIHEETNKQLKTAQKRNKLDLKAQDIENSTLNILARTTCDWNITYGGKKPKLNEKSAKELYSDVFWIKDQVEEAETNYLDFTNS
jgi:hypothetical protein